MTRTAALLAGLFLACWAVVLLHRLGLVELAGSLPLALYPLYSLAAALGWAAGITYARLRRGTEGLLRRRLFLIFLVGPPGLLFLLRAMAPVAHQQAAPLVPLFAFGVYAALFAVPVKMPGPWSR